MRDDPTNLSDGGSNAFRTKVADMRNNSQPAIGFSDLTGRSWPGFLKPLTGYVFAMRLGPAGGFQVCTLRVLSLTFALIALASPARAELIMWQFSGQFPTGSETFSLTAGDTFEFTIGIETDSYYFDGFTPWVGFAGHVGSHAVGSYGGGRFLRGDDLIFGELHSSSSTILTGDRVGPNQELIPFFALIHLTFAPGALGPRGIAPVTLPDPISIALELNYAYQPPPEAPLDWNPGPYLRFTTTNVARVPEPATLLLLGVGLIGAFGARRKDRSGHRSRSRGSSASSEL